MEDFSDFITFHVNGNEVNVLTIEADTGTNTVAEINNKYCYLGDVKPDVYAAISAWQIIFNRKLKDWEVTQNIQANTN